MQTCRIEGGEEKVNIDVEKEKSCSRSESSESAMEIKLTNGIDPDMLRGLISSKTRSLDSVLRCIQSPLFSNPNPVHIPPQTLLFRTADSSVDICRANIGALNSMQNGRFRTSSLNGVGGDLGCARAE